MMPLDPSRLGFSWPNARGLADASARAYVSPSITNATTSASALVEDRGDCIVVAFKGSKEPKDFEQDAEFWFADLVHEADGTVAQVHHGALADWESIEQQVTFAVKSYLTPATKPIFITGHSLGGMLAILCALEFERNNLPVAAVYTFGCPRVGNGIFSAIYNFNLGDKTFCVVNQNDIVPRTPPLLMGYRRVGQKVFLAAGSGWSVNPPLWSLLLSDALGLWSAYRNKCDVLITEHFIAAYQRRISLL